MEKQVILTNTRDYVQTELANEGSGHDWWHIVRVTNTALEIAKQEGADPYICELAALLHDIADEKLNESEIIGLTKVKTWLQEQGVEAGDLDHIMSIIENISFKGGQDSTVRLSLEGQVVQDADRLDALGAIGIARAMAYSGHKGRLIHDPKKQPRVQLDLATYRNGEDTAIMHFYEKLLKLKDLMNTAYGKQLAQGRHNFLETYLSQFYDEWDGKK